MYRFDVRAVNAAINYTTEAMGSERVLKAIYAGFSTAPTTPENFVVTLVSHLGADYNTILYSSDPGTDSVDYIANGGTPLNAPLHPDDKLKVTYTNTDARTIGVTLVLQ